MSVDGGEVPGPFDVDDLMARLDQSLKERELVAAQRPPKEALADSLSQFAGFLYDMLDLQGSIRTLERVDLGGRPYSWFPMDGSVAATDADEFAEQPMSHV